MEHCATERADLYRSQGAGSPGPLPLLRDAAQFCFSPQESEVLRRPQLLRGARRKTRVQPSQLSRKKKRPKRQPGVRYTTSAYEYAIRRAAAKAGVDHWAPNMLRHSAGTAIRRAYDVEAARVILGHREVATTVIDICRPRFRAARGDYSGASAGARTQSDEALT